MVVRIAGPNDKAALYDFLVALHKDNGMGIPMSETKVRSVVDEFCEHRGSVAAIIDGPDGSIAASVGISFAQWWYSQEYYLTELWLFVRPEYRTYGYADQLAEFCKNYRSQMRSSETGQSPPLVTSVTSRTRLDAKARWWRRWSKPIGYIFVIEDD